MVATQSAVRYCRLDQSILFLVEGRATLRHGLDLRKAAEQAISGGATLVSVDLNRCTYMDSTFLGTLLYLKRAADRKGQAQLELVAPSPPCRQLFEQMGLAGIFVCVAARVPAGPWQELTSELVDSGAIKLGVVEAHQELANLPGPAHEKFEPVARLLTEALKSEKPKAPSR